MSIDFKQARHLQEGDAFLARGQVNLVLHVSTDDTYRKQVTTVHAVSIVNHSWMEDTHTYLSRDEVQVVHYAEGGVMITRSEEEESNESV